MSWMPPYGWWSSERGDQTTVCGWDWMLGAVTLLHGFFTLPICVGLAGSALLGGAVWFLASVSLAAGVGWCVVVDADGFRFYRTLWGVRVVRRRLGRDAPLLVEDDVYAPSNADFSEWVQIGTNGRAWAFGTRQNARPIGDALETAVARHHRTSAGRGT